MSRRHQIQRTLASVAGAAQLAVGPSRRAERSFPALSAVCIQRYRDWCWSGHGHGDYRAVCLGGAAGVSHRPWCQSAPEDRCRSSHGLPASALCCCRLAKRSCWSRSAPVVCTPYMCWKNRSHSVKRNCQAGPPLAASCCAFSSPVKARTKYERDKLR